MTGRGALALAVTLLLVAATARLGFWQLDRAAQKLALEQERQERARLPLLTLPDLAAAEGARGDIWQRRASLSGIWAADETIYLDNRTLQGRAGFYVITPLLLEDGRAVLVQRGWLPRDVAERTRIAPYRTPPGAVQVSGLIAPQPSRMVELGQAASGPIRQNVDIDAYARETRRRLLPFVVVQDSVRGGSAGSTDGLLRDWPPVTTGVHTNYGYALQWFALCALLIGLYVWFQIIQPRRRARG
ncbi:MAG: SURF1 family protein [Rubrivivax sp.]|nr:SURF1 family protein [Rubrivivax sp.]